MNILAWFLQAILAICYVIYSVVLVMPPRHMKRLFDDVPFSLRVVVAAFAGVAALLLVLPIVVKSLTRMIPPAAFVLMVIAAGEALFMLVRGQSSVAMVRAALFVIALVLFLIRWRTSPNEYSKTRTASRA